MFETSLHILRGFVCLLTTNLAVVFSFQRRTLAFQCDSVSHRAQNCWSMVVSFWQSWNGKVNPTKTPQASCADIAVFILQCDWKFTAEYIYFHR